MKSTRLRIPVEELQKMPTKRLLSYYKTMRAKTSAYIKNINSTNPFSKDELKSDIKAIKEANEYLHMLKSMLDSREHIERKNC